MAKARNYTQGKPYRTLICHLEAVNAYRLSRNLSASRAAIQPDPAEVTAWR
jgi:hypothetical protein